MQRLGQHFLTDQNTLKKIVEAIEPQRGDCIVEIGAGHGELTLPLDRACEEIGCAILAIEKDRALASALKENKLLSRTEVIWGDALQFIKERKEKRAYRVVGNIPYYMSGRLLRVLEESKRRPSLVVLTMQKEVAERMSAQPPRMNKLAAAIQFWSVPKIIGSVAKQAFRPPPKVESRIVALRPTQRKKGGGNYYRMVAILFRQPRKTILNNLRAEKERWKEEEVKEKIGRLGITGLARPQELSVELIEKLADAFFSKKPRL